jgi:signal transduction histidine kinase
VTERAQPTAVGRGSRLIVRIYLGALVGILTIAAVFYCVHHYLLEPPWARSLQRQAMYVTDTVLAVAEKPATVTRVTQRVQRELQASLTVYRANGTVLTSTVDPPLPPLGPAQLARFGSEDAFTVGGGHGALVAAAVRKDGRLAAYGLYVAHRASAPLRDAAIDLSIILLGVAVMSVVAARVLTRPLARLAAAARALGSGQLDARVGLRRRDEFGRVARAFDDMADRITQLLRSQKELLANVSHELRTPLSRIKVALDLASEGDASLARESLGEIAEDLAELERLVDDILTAGRLDMTAGSPGGTPPLHREPVDPRALVEKAATRFQGAHPERPFVLQIEGTLPPLDADPALLRRAILNLLDNAHKYSEPPTTVTLRARPQGSRLVVEVADRGIGIDPEDLPRVFEPFFRADRSRTRRTGGVGLGLALVRGIVLAHGGTIDIQSRVGEGTTVRLTVPGAAAGEAPAAA